MIDAGQDCRELVAAHARDGVAGPQATRDPFRHNLEKLIAHLVAERVVDLFESVEVQKHYADSPCLAVRHANELVQSILEERTVWLAGQVVVICLTPYHLLLLLTLRDVRNHPEHPGECAIVVVIGACRDNGPDVGTVLVLVADVVLLTLALLSPRKSTLRLRARVRIHEVVNRTPH